MIDADRFWSRVDQTGDCWLWLGRQFRGYGTTWFRGRNRQAHRIAYELLVGPVPAGLELDHLCRVKACVNPAHLEPVTHVENTRRARRTHCRRGHPLDEANTRLTPAISGKGYAYIERRCRICEQIKDARKNPAKRASYRDRKVPA